MKSRSFFALLSLVLSANALPRRQVDNGPIEGWEAIGCHTDSAVPRTLSDAAFADPLMTPALCTAFCQEGGFGFAGVEFGLECFCGYTVSPAGTIVPDAQCAVPCGGDPTITCGAGNRVYIYTNGQEPPSAPAEVGEWVYQGCFTDLVNDERTLLRRIEIPEVVSINTCTAGCKSEGHRFAGLEYGGECWCGDAISANATLVNDNQCSMTCVGDRTQLCGGPFRLTLYADSENPLPEDPEDPEDPEEPPTDPEDPEDPEEPPTDPEDPEDPEEPPTDPEEPPTDPEEPPTDPEDPEEPPVEPTPTVVPEDPEPTPIPEEPIPEEPVPEEPVPEEPVPEEPVPEEP